MGKGSQGTGESVGNFSTHEFKKLIRLGYLSFEKCELAEARDAFVDALRLAQLSRAPKRVAEALVGLLRYAGETLDRKQITKWERELDQLIEAYPQQIPPIVWYCKGVLATLEDQWKAAQRFFHRSLNAGRRDRTKERELTEARALTMLANCAQKRGCLGRADFLTELVLDRYETQKLRGITGVAYLIRGTTAERRGNTKAALQYFQRAHAAYLEEHNWYHHLYVLYGYARIARIKRQYPQAYFYLDLIEKAASSPEFGVLNREIEREKRRLQDDAVDFLVDSQNGTVRTRENEKISLGKQYVLLEILRALIDAHSRERAGLSKGEIIEQVWKTSYRPEFHDNKLYYNINRLRRLIEPNVKKPKYLLNWKSGYRLAPGLRTQLREDDSGWSTG